MRQICVVGNYNPDLPHTLEEINAELERKGIEIELVEFSTDEVPIYLNIPWNKLLKRILNHYPEFKADDGKRKLLKSRLWNTEQNLNAYIESTEEEVEYLILSYDDTVHIEQTVQLIIYKYEGKIL